MFHAIISMFPPRDPFASSNASATRRGSFTFSMLPGASFCDRMKRECFVLRPSRAADFLFTRFRNRVKPVHQFQRLFQFVRQSVVLPAVRADRVAFVDDETACVNA